ncbi:MAG: DNA topoisomerase IB, partial [Candidatus Eremiobacteraeota bacterium]|nr:DNA topoisomerase IB [Candidatus Eremiobacteraeota bacterium]
LAIPPAYREVWICPIPNGHIQATARDARGRKQYRYHKRWREVRDEAKFHRMAAFGETLPKIRAAVARDLRSRGLSREKILAVAVTFLERTAIRIGNEEYRRSNGSFGLTTLRTRHVRVRGSKINVRFRGKTGVEHEVALDDARLAKIVRECRDLPGEELFTYLDDEGGVHTIGSEDVNAYIREISGDDFTAKDFRTWAATRECIRRLGKPAEDAAEAKRNVKEAIACVAARLGNTAAVCRKAYIHPAVLEVYARYLRLPSVPRGERAVIRLLSLCEKALDTKTQLRASLRLVQ